MLQNFRDMPSAQISRFCGIPGSNLCEATSPSTAGYAKSHSRPWNAGGGRSLKVSEVTGANASASNGLVRLSLL